MNRIATLFVIITSVLASCHCGLLCAPQSVKIVAERCEKLRVGMKRWEVEQIMRPELQFITTQWETYYFGPDFAPNRASIDLEFDRRKVSGNRNDMLLKLPDVIHYASKDNSELKHVQIHKAKTPD